MGFSPGVFLREPHIAAFSRRLASSARLILFDKRGTGLSDQVPRLSPTLEEWMDHVQAVQAARWHEEDCDLSVQGLATGRTVEVAEELIAHAPPGADRGFESREEPRGQVGDSVRAGSCCLR